MLFSLELAEGYKTFPIFVRLPHIFCIPTIVKQVCDAELKEPSCVVW